MTTNVCDFLDTLSSNVRQQADSIILVRQRAPQNVFEGRLRPYRSAVVGGPYRDAMNIAQHNAQYKHFRGRAYSAVRVIANRIAAQPIYVARRRTTDAKSLKDAVREGDIARDSIPSWAIKGIDFDKYELVESHDLIETLAEPNSLMVQQTMMEFMIYNLFVTGMSFLMVSQSQQRGRKYDLLPLPTTWVQPKWDAGRITGWDVRPPGDDGEPIPVDHKYMLRFFLPDPSNPTAAISPMNMLAHAILNDESIAEAQHANFRNEGAPSVALIAGEDADMVLGSGSRGSGLASLTPEQRQEIVDWFRQEYADVSRHGLPMVLDNIIKDIKILARTPKDMAFLESAGVTKEQIFEGYGVPAVAAGQIENVTRESSATAEGHLLRNAINPTIRMMGQVMRRGLVPLFSTRSNELTVWIEEAKPDDPSLEVDWWSMAQKYFAITLNDVRRKIGLKPLLGGDVVALPQRARLVRLDEELPVEVLGVGNPKAETPEDTLDDLRSNEGVEE